MLVCLLVGSKSQMSADFNEVKQKMSVLLYSIFVSSCFPYTLSILLTVFFRAICVFRAVYVQKWSMCGCFLQVWPLLHVKCFLFMFFLPQYSLVNEPLIELTNPGASGSLFYLTSDDEFIIKTVQHKEAKFLQRLLPGYYMVRHLKSLQMISRILERWQKLKKCLFCIYYYIRLSIFIYGLLHLVWC